jgi:Arc/MetJ-type ribon-helix-helix transcriptional regulator
VVNNTVYSDTMVQVQLRLPEESISEIDKWVSEGKFKNRSDAIRTILALYQEKEKTREFYKMLVRRSNEAKENPDILIPLEDIDEL